MAAGASTCLGTQSVDEVHAFIQTQFDERSPAEVAREVQAGDAAFAVLRNSGQVRVGRLGLLPRQEGR